MVIEFKATIKYQETFIAGKRDPDVVLKNLLEADIFSDYVIYEKDSEIRLAGNELASVTVSQDSVWRKGIDKFYCEPVNDPFKQIEELLASLPIENWTAYGYIAFDLARYYFPYHKAIEQPLFHFLIPETELRLTEEGIYLRSTKSLDRIRSILESKTEIPNNEYQESVNKMNTMLTNLVLK
jgi:salicylate synthetase